jgi:hypothetical protein
MKKYQKRILYGLAAAGVVIGLRPLMKRILDRRLIADMKNSYTPRTNWSEPGWQQRYRQEEQMEDAQMMETRYQEEPERQAIPQTGMGTSETAYLAEEMVNPVPLETDTAEMVTLLVQHLLAYSEMMKLLRMRRETEALSERSLTPEDRGRVMKVLEKLDDTLTRYSAGNLEDGSLQERIYRLTLKTRDAMENLTYDDADLFRINGEVRPEACRLVREIRQVGAVPEANLADVSEEYRCV